jgi:hypothetical protein
VQVHAAQRDRSTELRGDCGPLYNAPFDHRSGEVARFEDSGAGLSVQVLGSSVKGYRVRVTRTSLVPQGRPSASAQPEPGQALAPPYFGGSFFAALGWGLKYPVAD